MTEIGPASSIGTQETRIDPALSSHPGQKIKLNQKSRLTIVRDRKMELQVQLKVCEGCGCLWYRPMDHGRVYCQRCEVKLKDFAVPDSRKRRGRPIHRPIMKIWAVADVSGGAE